MYIDMRIGIGKEPNVCKQPIQLSIWKKCQDIFTSQLLCEPHVLWHKRPVKGSGAVSFDAAVFLFEILGENIHQSCFL